MVVQDVECRGEGFGKHGALVWNRVWNFDQAALG
jgi:hypothetical protein